MARRRPGRPASYDWDLWFNQIKAPGSSFALKAGRDFVCTPESMQGMIAATARARGVRVKTTKLEGGCKIRVQPIFAARYPWDRWLDGRVHRLRKDRDFHCTWEALRGLAYQQAKSRGVKIVTKFDSGLYYIRVDPRVTPWCVQGHGDKVRPDPASDWSCPTCDSNALEPSQT